MSPRLNMYLPFALASCAPDLQVNATDVESLPIAGYDVYGTQITEGALVHYGGSEEFVRDGDVLIVHAHGFAPKPDVDCTPLSNGLGGELDLKQAISTIEAIGGKNAAHILFVVCFSAFENRIAWEWKKKYPSQNVYGSQKPVGGSMVTRTRQGTLRTAMWSGDRLTLLN